MLDSVRLAADAPGKTAEDDPPAWIPAIHVRDQNGIPHSCLGLLLSVSGVQE